MRKDIIINTAPHEVRVAILEDGEIVELLIERADARRIVGNIYKGKVTSVKPGLQAAFVDIGLEKAGFLHASDLAARGDLGDVEEDDDEPAGERRGRRRPASPTSATCSRSATRSWSRSPRNPSAPRARA